ncbi:transposase [Rhizobium sp. BK060]|nr:transposase [Rhizobium sp. BK060]
MQANTCVFVGLDTSKLKISVALAEDGRLGDVRFMGDIDSSPDSVRRLIEKLSRKYAKLSFCYEAGPTGYGLHRQITDLGHECAVIAPSLIPKKAGERVKTNRRDALTLARLHRAGELTAIWVPDSGHEAVRDLVRAREAAMQDLREKRQHLQAFLLRHGRIYPGLRPWTKVHARWLANLIRLSITPVKAVISGEGEVLAQSSRRNDTENSHYRIAQRGCRAHWFPRHIHQSADRRHVPERKSSFGSDPGGRNESRAVTHSQCRPGCGASPGHLGQRRLAGMMFPIETSLDVPAPLPLPFRVT